MNFLGIGPMELIFIIIIMILVLGPKNMITTAQKLGVTLRKIVKSPIWATVMDTSREIREIPTRLIREAGIEEDMKTIRETTDSIKKAGNVTVPYSVSTSEKGKVAKQPESTTLSTEKVEEKTQSVAINTEKVEEKLTVTTETESPKPAKVENIPPQPVNKEEKTEEN